MEKILLQLICGKTLLCLDYSGTLSIHLVASGTETFESQSVKVLSICFV